MTLSIGTIAAIVDDATRQSLNDLVHKLVNTGVDRLIQDLLSQWPESSNAGNNRILENVDNIAEDCKVNLVSIHLFDLALMWHKQFVKFMRDNVDWNVYRRAMLKRFDVAYDDPLGEIKNLKQTNTMQEYIDAFDRLLCRINLEADQCISFFLASLSTETELVVRMFKPRTLAEVYGLCKLEEAKVNAVKQKPKPPILPTPRYQNQFLDTGSKPMALPAPNATWRTKPVTLLGDDTQEVLDIEIIGETNGELITEIEKLIQYSPHISLNVINGTNNYQTMRICGHVGKHKLHILVDYGSTHNFLDLNTAKKLGCQLISTCPMQVEIAGGIKLLSKYMCKSFTWKCRGNIFTYFKELRMEFKYNGKKVLFKDNVEKTAFKTHRGRYEFLVMPFGLTNAHSSFQALMNSVFKAYLRRFVLVFFDDILVYSLTLETHVRHLELVLQVLRQNTLYAKQSKCVFGTEKVKYLGHVITKKRVATDNSKIEAIQNWLVPTNLKQLRGFLGLTSYYRRFLKSYVVNSHPLTQLLKKNGFEWTATTQITFDKLKQDMMEALVLKLPKFSELFVIEIDASHAGIRAVLQQGGHPVMKGLSEVQSLREQHQTYSSQRHRQGSQRSLEDIRQLGSLEDIRQLGWISAEEQSELKLL
ncbi:gypsy/ty3 retroelement polyprotein [Tanacetum coccineum]